MGWEPHVTVAVVVERDGRFLVVEENAERGRIVYNQPAGHVEKGETLEQAAVREALEETGWDVRLTGFLGLYVYTPPFDRDRRRHPADRRAARAAGTRSVRPTASRSALRGRVHPVSSTCGDRRQTRNGDSRQPPDPYSE